MSATSIDLGTVLRRHRRAMSVIDLVEYESAFKEADEYLFTVRCGTPRAVGA